MSDEETRDPEGDEEGHVVEIDWGPVEMAIEGLADGGIDLADGEAVLNHVAVLVASCLRRMSEEEGWDEETVAEAAAQTAAFAVDLALSDDEIPDFELPED